MDLSTLSHQERRFIVNGVEDGLRNDGRGLFRPLDYRPIHVESGVLPSANGSARARVGAGATDVLVSVKAELASMDNIEERLPNRLNFFIDFSAVASPQFTGRGGNDLGEELASAFYSAYNNADALPELNSERCLLSATHMWSVYVDVVVVRAGGNVVDAISLGVKAALANTQVCEVVARPADADKVLIDLPDEITTWSFDVSRAPLLIAVNQLGQSAVVDADDAEEASSPALLLVGVMPSGEEPELRVTCVKKLGGSPLELSNTQAMIRTAQKVGNELNSTLMQWLQKEEPKITGAIDERGELFIASRTFLK